MATTAATLTGAQYDSLPYEEARPWELIEGELVEVPSTTFEHQSIATRLLFAVQTYIQSNLFSSAAMTDVEFALAENVRVRPDVWVIVGERSKTFDRFKSPIPGAPDIAIEVISPSERTSNSMRKVDVYLAHGVQEVWQVYPETRQVFIHTSGNLNRLRVDGALTTPLLPGFELALASLFLH